ncbi:alpha/beta hydrolase [Labrys okinawensis]|uniref:alpha/beta hydrolase n=1 Tax=Labrys okinawensis TaxID=346911 RepID=UPI0039BC9D03
MMPLDGPRLPAKFGKTRQLVVFLHGYGADGNDLIDLGQAWRELLPDTAFVSPHAPEPCAGAPYGRQWFPLTFRVRNERWDGVRRAGPMLDAFLDAELEREGLEDDALALVGFSQGSMMALHTGLRRRKSMGAIVGYSGILIGPDDQPLSVLTPEITARPPVLLVHGDQDQVVPPMALPYSVEGLKALGVPVEAHMRPGLGHGIDSAGLRLGGDFLAQAFARTA